MVIDHVNLPVSDLERSRAFYEIALRPLGIRIVGKDRDAIGFGCESWAFGIVLEACSFPGLHIAFAASSTTAVGEFYTAALEAGGRDNGPPGPRPQYGASYYSAFVLDPDGHNVEAVCRNAARTI